MVVLSPAAAYALGYQRSPGTVQVPLYVRRKMERVPGPLHAQVYRAVDQDLSIQSVVETVLQSSMDKLHRCVFMKEYYERNTIKYLPFNVYLLVAA